MAGGTQLKTMRWIMPQRRDVGKGLLSERAEKYGGSLDSEEARAYCPGIRVLQVGNWRQNVGVADRREFEDWGSCSRCLQEILYRFSLLSREYSRAHSAMVCAGVSRKAQRRGTDIA